MTPVGFVGLGSQGAPIAHRIAAAGFALHVWARRTEVLPPFIDAGAVASPDLRALGQACDVVGVCVSADADVESVVLGDDGILSGMAPGGVIAVHATVAPVTVQELAASTAERGVHLLDAPVSGGPQRAAAGTMTTMVGGTAEALAIARPVFDAFSRVVAHLGPVGAGQLMKLLNNNLAYANVAMAISALEVAERLGMDRAVTSEVLAVSSGNSVGLSIVTDPIMFAKASGSTSNVPKDVAHFRDLMIDAGLAGEPMPTTAASAPAAIADLAQRRQP